MTCRQPRSARNKPQAPNQVLGDLVVSVATRHLQVSFNRTQPSPPELQIIDSYYHHAFINVFTDHSTDRGDDDDTDEDNQQEEDTDLTVTDVVLPTLANYATLGVDWTDAYLEKVLAGRKIGSNNRPSVAILLEAQALQDTFQRSLKMLSLAGQISYPTLKASL